jgi:peptidoglycan hydrolase CwlO-like protein
MIVTIRKETQSNISDLQKEITLLQKDVKIHKKTVTDLDAESKKIEENMK